MIRRTAEKPVDGSIVASAIYTQPEACKLLRLGRVSLLLLRQRGELDYVVMLSSVRYPGAHLIAYIDRCERKHKDCRR